MPENTHHTGELKIATRAPMRPEDERRLLQEEIDVRNIAALVWGKLMITKAGATNALPAIRYYAPSRESQDPRRPRRAGPWVTRQEAIVEFPGEYEGFKQAEAMRKTQMDMESKTDTTSSEEAVVIQLHRGSHRPYNRDIT